MSRSRFLLGPLLGTLLVGLALYGAFCVNVGTAPTTPPAVTLVVVQPASPSPTVYVFATPTAREMLPLASPSPTTPPAVIILDDPLPTMTPPPSVLILDTPTPTNTKVTVQRG